MSGSLLRIRWSWRDLRARWLQVAAIALVIGIGSGVFSGLSSVSDWRRVSYAASFDTLSMYDLRIELADGTYVDAAELEATVNGIEHAASLTGVDARLTESVQVDASTADEVVLVPGRLVGIPVSDGRVNVAGPHVFSGRPLEPQDAGRSVVLVAESFADDHGIEPPTEITLSGGREVEVVGRATAPEHFIVIGDRGSIFADFAVLWAPIETVQELAGRPGAANDVVVRVVNETERDAVEADIRAALDTRFPDAGYEITHREDDRVLRLLFDDIEGDQRFYDIFALLILAGAAFAAFNLTGRVVESQRREIGIGMALGVPPAQLAVRPLLFAGQVALFGVVFGVGVGLLLGAAMSSLLATFQPLPVWDTSLQLDQFARGAALGLALPFLAAAIPVWRAVRVEPVDAISTTHRRSRSGLVGLLRHVPLPGKSLSEMPVRNVMRAPWRTLLTALGIAAALAALVGLVGMIDSFLETVDRGDAEIVGDAPDRVNVALDFFYAADDPVVTGVADSPLVGAAEPRLEVGGTLDPGGEDIDVFVIATDFGSDIWRPTAIEGALETDEPGIVLAQTAAEDLHVGPGDPVTVRHPFREGLGARFEVTTLPVLAIHPNPFRFVAYVDVHQTGFMNLDGIVNTVEVTPAAGVSTVDLQRALFGRPGVATVEPVTAAADSIRDQLEEFVGVFTIIEIAVLILALLIAFNATAISMDERARENATMFAFGVPVRSAMRVAVTESLLVGLLGTAIGLVVGRLILAWLIEVLVPQTLPDIGIVQYVSATTVVTAIVLGVVAVTIAPLFTLRRLRRMDIPDTLRVME